MKRLIFLSLILLTTSFVFAQNTIEGISKPIHVNITKDPPILIMDIATLTFTDENGNNIIDANEKCIIQFTVENKGKGDATDLTALVSESNAIAGLIYPKAEKKGFLAPGEKKIIKLSISSNMSLISGKAKFIIKLDEANGFGLDEFPVEVNTREFVKPFVKVPDYVISSDNGQTILKKRPFEVQIIVQNIGYGIAENVKVQLQLPENTMSISDNETMDFPSLKPGEQKTIVYSLIVSDKFIGTQIPLQVNLSERYKRFSENKTITLQLNQSVSNAKLVVENSNTQNYGQIMEASLSSDVDKNIPQNLTANEHAYALIIGNEDYSSFQTGLSAESNVPFAINDARIFKEYCIKTLGIPEKQIKLLTNATSGQMKQGIAWLSNLAKLEGGNAKLIFYYSGHGLPDENTKDAYLIPVDISGINLNQGIKLADAYASLNENRTENVSVFLDACFSGGSRNQGLLAMKGVRIVPKNNNVIGNMVVFTSSSGDESSGILQEKQHGYMTYFLLKKLQQTNGNCSYKELADYITDNVKKESALNGKIQTPQVLYNPEIETKWPIWKLR